MPVRRNDLESFSPEIKNLESNPDLQEKYETWLERRKQAMSYGTHGELAVKGQGQYIRGEHVGGNHFVGHQTKLNVRAFREVEPEPPAPQSTLSDKKPLDEKANEGVWKRLFNR